MTQQSIYINHQGELLLIDAPEKPNYFCEGYSETNCPDMDDSGRANVCLCQIKNNEYKAALASAIARGVKIKDNKPGLKLKECYTEDGFIDFGKIFPLPTGYKVNFEKFSMIVNDWINCDQKSGDNVRAILSKLDEEKTGVPKSRNRPAPPVVAPSEEVKAPFIGGYQPTNTVDTSNPPRQKAPVLEVENALRSHQDYKDGLKILEKHLGDLYYQCGNMHGDIFEAMQEYASQERNRAIQELSKKLKEGLDNYGCKRDVAGKWVLEDNVFHVLRELLKKDS